MTDSTGIVDEIQRQTLEVALRNSAKTVLLLFAAVLYIAWLGWQVGAPTAAVVTVMLGALASVSRWFINHRYGGKVSLGLADAFVLIGDRFT